MTILGAICLAAGAAAVGTGAVIRRLNKTAETRHSLRWVALVLENEKRDGQNYPLLTYEIENTHFTTRYKLGTKRLKYLPGDNVRLRINPNDPEDIYIEPNPTFSYDNIGKWVIAAGVIIALTAFFI